MAKLQNAWGYQGDPMNLPVADVESSVAFYEKAFGFNVVSRDSAPQRSAILERDGIRMGLAENGGDPTQDGCAFQVDDVESLYEEFKSNGLSATASSDPEGSISPELKIENRKDGTSWKVFFVVAPDSLCFWFGEKL